MACVPFSLFLRHVSPPGCFHGLCHPPVGHFQHVLLISCFHGVCCLQDVFMACVAFRMFFSAFAAFRLFLRCVSPSGQPFLACVTFTLVSWCLSYFALYLGFIARVAYNLPRHVPPSSCCHGVCRLKVRRFQTSFYNVCRPQVSSAAIVRIPFRLVCLWYFLLLVQFLQFVSSSVQYLVSPALIYSVCRSSLLGSFWSCISHFLYFAVCVFSVCVLLRISCSLSCFYSCSLLLTFQFPQLVPVIRKFSSLFLDLCLFVSVIEVKTLVFCSLFPRALLFSRLIFTWHF